MIIPKGGIVMEDTYFMDEALALAREAAADGEVPAA